MAWKAAVFSIGAVVLVCASAGVAADRLVPSIYPTIQAGIDAAGPGDTVIVAPGTYTGVGNRNLDFGGKAITVRSAGAEDPCVVAATVIDCEYRSRGLYFHSGEDANSVVSGLTIKHGSVGGSPARGGGICCIDSSPTIQRCTITDSRAIGNEGSTFALGAGIYSGGGSTTIALCRITDNAAYGGGISSWPLVAAGDGFGGGIYLEGGIPRVSGCVISGNSAYGGSSVGAIQCECGGMGGSSLGGGVFVLSGKIESCIIVDNTAVRGGGGSGNSCCPDAPDGEGDGGGAFVGSGASVQNCTIVWNQADDTGGGVLIASGEQARLENCIVRANSATSFAQIRGTAVVSYTDVEGGWDGTGNIDVDPCFVSGPEGDYYLSQVAAGQGVDSPCVDAGSDWAENLGMDIYTTRTDEIGDAGIVDMGYHYPVAVRPGAADVDGDGDVDLEDYSWFALGWYYGTPNQIPMGAVVVDGNLADWPEDVQWRDLDKVYYLDPNDVVEARFALQWDPNTDKIYAAVIVSDSDQVFTDGYVHWDASDRIELYSQGDAEGGTGWVGDYNVAQQYMVGPNTSGGLWGTWALGESLTGDEGLEYQVVVEGEQIVYEVGVKQFDNYGGFGGGATVVTELDVGDVVGFDLVLDTRWSGGFGMLSENLMAGKSGNADQFARYVLVAKIGRGDLDGNGVIDALDLDIITQKWLAGK